MKSKGIIGFFLGCVGAFIIKEIITILLEPKTSNDEEITINHLNKAEIEDWFEESKRKKVKKLILAPTEDNICKLGLDSDLIDKSNQSIIQMLLIDDYDLYIRVVHFNTIDPEISRALNENKGFWLLN